MTAPSTVRRLVRAGAARAFQLAKRPSQARVLYNSFNGRYSDNPRAIFEELTGRTPAREHIWMAARDVVTAPATTVEPYTVPYLREASRAGYIVSNIEMPRNLNPRRGTTYLQTWHGTPLKRIGFDNPRWKENPRGLDRMAREFAKWDYLIAQSPFSAEIFRRAFRFDGDMLEVGYPRNDLLSSTAGSRVRSATRATLGIGDDVQLTLYAPTWRDTAVDHGGALQFSAAQQVVRLAEELGEGHALMLRLHYLLASQLGDLGPSVINVSGHPDIRDLYLAADILVTDYSSAMFDFAVTGKPMVFFTYDLEQYRDGVRGFYFDLEAEVPGPVCRTTEEVLVALQGDHGGYDRKYADFRERFSPFDDGGAARRVVERVFS